MRVPFLFSVLCALFATAGCVLLAAEPGVAHGSSTALTKEAGRFLVTFYYDSIVNVNETVRVYFQVVDNETVVNGQAQPANFSNLSVTVRFAGPRGEVGSPVALVLPTVEQGFFFGDLTLPDAAKATYAVALPSGTLEFEQTIAGSTTGAPSSRPASPSPFPSWVLLAVGVLAGVSTLGYVVFGRRKSSKGKRRKR